MSEEHESFIKTPKQLITVVVLAFVVPILIIVLLVKFVTSGESPTEASPPVPASLDAEYLSVRSPRSP